MKTSDFSYYLPQELIAQSPIEPRDSARLMVVNRLQRQFEHSQFRLLGEYLEPGDLLVINETRVIRARLFGRKIPSGGKIEILLLSQIDEYHWNVLIGGKGLVAGKRLEILSGPTAEIVEVKNGAERVIQFDESITKHLDNAGTIPLPPYIHEPLRDPDRYQTIFARTPGSSAAPTAGLHFTQRLVTELQEQGILFSKVLLHIGLDTFNPINEEDPRKHPIHTEWCQVSQDTVDAICATKRNGHRVIAVGTTSVRALESAANLTEQGLIKPFAGSTRLFILPGYEYRIVDGIITNFHLPRSTLVMMISAFLGREWLLDLYENAKKNGYRFFSFGDAMLIL